MSDNVVHLHKINPQPGDQVLRPARCVGRGPAPACGWDGYLVRTVGEDKIPPCPRCGSWTEAIVAPRSVMRRFQHCSDWPR